jgi:hypothetical protein
MPVTEPTEEVKVLELLKSRNRELDNTVSGIKKNIDDKIAELHKTFDDTIDIFLKDEKEKNMALVPEIFKLIEKKFDKMRASAKAHLDTKVKEIGAGLAEDLKTAKEAALAADNAANQAANEAGKFKTICDDLFTKWCTNSVAAPPALPAAVDDVPGVTPAAPPVTPAKPAGTPAAVTAATPALPAAVAAAPPVTPARSAETPAAGTAATPAKPAGTPAAVTAATPAKPAGTTAAVTAATPAKPAETPAAVTAATPDGNVAGEGEDEGEDESDSAAGSAGSGGSKRERYEVKYPVPGKYKAIARTMSSKTPSHKDFWAGTTMTLEASDSAVEGWAFCFPDEQIMRNAPDASFLGKKFHLRPDRDLYKDWNKEKESFKIQRRA